MDASGETSDGRPFADIRTFRAHLVRDERLLAVNLARQLTTYATGAPVRFADRATIEAIVTATRSNHYGVRSLIHALVQSELFLRQ